MELKCIHILNDEIRIKLNILFESVEEKVSMYTVYCSNAVTPLNNALPRHRANIILML